MLNKVKLGLGIGAVGAIGVLGIVANQNKVENMSTKRFGKNIAFLIKFACHYKWLYDHCVHTLPSDRMDRWFDRIDYLVYNKIGCVKDPMDLSIVVPYNVDEEVYSELRDAVNMQKNYLILSDFDFTKK